MKKLLKPALLLLLLAGLMAGTALCASAADDGDRITVTTGYSIYIDGTQLDPRDANYDRVEAIAYNGTTYLPVRALCNALGMTDLSYDAATKTVRINKGAGYSSYGFDPLPPQRDVPEKSLEIVTGITVYVNDVKLEPKDAKGNPVEVFAWNGTTYLPVRALCNAIGIPAEDLHYEAASRSVYIGEYVPKAAIPELTDFLGLEHQAMGTNRSTGWWTLNLYKLTDPASMHSVMNECAILLAQYDLELTETVYDSFWNQYTLCFSYTGDCDVSACIMCLNSYDASGNKIEHEIRGSLYLTFDLPAKVGQTSEYYDLRLYCSNDFKTVVDGAKVSVEVRYLEEEEPEPTVDSSGRVKCTRCGGDGDCTTCGGDGKVRKLLAGTREWVNQKCTSCRPSGSGNCSSCGGKGYK